MNSPNENPGFEVFKASLKRDIPSQHTAFDHFPKKYRVYVAPGVFF